MKMTKKGWLVFPLVEDVTVSYHPVWGWWKKPLFPGNAVVKVGFTSSLISGRVRHGVDMGVRASGEELGFAEAILPYVSTLFSALLRVVSEVNEKYPLVSRSTMLAGVETSVAYCVDDNRRVVQQFSSRYGCFRFVCPPGLKWTPQPEPSLIRQDGLLVGFDEGRVAASRDAAEARAWLEAVQQYATRTHD